jgi:DNA-binding NtrC family response regulator
MVMEVLDLDGYNVRRVRTEAQAWSLLTRQPGRCVVFLDNLDFHQEGQQFLLKLRTHPDVRARVKVVCMAASGHIDRFRQEYGDAIDAYLIMPFTVPQLLNSLVFS